jgi:hypothetical protein
MLRPEEKLVFEAFYDALPDFAGRSVSWHPGNDPPDIICVDSEGNRMGIELGEWLNEEQIRSSIEQERLEDSYLNAIRSQDSHPPENIGMIWLTTKIGLRLKQSDTIQFRTQFYDLVAAINSNWLGLDGCSSPNGVFFKDFSQYPCLDKYLQALRFYPRSEFNPPSGFAWIRFPSRGGAYSPKTALDALSDLIIKKTNKYADLHKQEQLDELYLIIYYNKALIYNTPFQIPGFGFREVADSIAPVLKDNHGVFQKVFLFNAIKQDQETILVWPS